MNDTASIPGSRADAASEAATPDGLLPALGAPSPRAYLEGLGAKDDIGQELAPAALALSSLDHPDTSVAPYHDHLAALQNAAAAATSATASVDMQAAALLDVVGGTFGYRGDSETYEDMRNADLMSVIDRRRGLPVALGILYMHAVCGYGGRVSGLAFPAHFCIRIEARGQRLIVDPFEGAVLRAQDLRARLKERVHRDAEILPAHHQSVSARDILLRLQNNIYLRSIRSGDLDRAKEIAERMVLLAPERSELRRELALIHARRGDIGEAVTTLESFLAQRAEPAPDHGELETLLRRLRTSLTEP